MMLFIHLKYANWFFEHFILNLKVHTMSVSSLYLIADKNSTF